jgi:hypothetical protein
MTGVDSRIYARYNQRGWVAKCSQRRRHHRQTRGTVDAVDLSRSFNVDLQQLDACCGVEPTDPGPAPGHIACRSGHLDIECLGKGSGQQTQTRGVDSIVVGD